MAPAIYIILCVLLFLLPTAMFLIYLLSVDLPGPRTLYHTIGRDVKAGYLYLKALIFITRCRIQNITLIDLFRNVAKKRKDKVCFIFEDKEWTYKEVDELSNKVANCFLSQGFRKGDEVALLLENCPDYVCIWLGLAKIGVICGFINTNLGQSSLAHSINAIDSKALIFGKNLTAAVKEAIPYLSKRDAMKFFCYSEQSATDTTLSFPAKSLNSLLLDASENPIDATKFKVGFQDKLLYIYTSGTTGLPKAAIIRHSRYLFILAASRYVCQLSDDEIFYNPLPMYHTAGGLIFVSMVLNFGGTMILRKKFSASNFWKEAVKYKATVSQYIGEICRYLLNQPKTYEETQHKIKLLFGNGLRPHIWKEFQNRFKIERIMEIYGATEGNANIINIFGKTGAVGFLPRILSRIYPVYLIKVNPETGEPLRNKDGLCIRCKPGEPGEMVGTILKHNPMNSFDGYVNQADTQKKIIADCFQKGDLVFSSGDILVMDDEGYLYFVDRTGDTFRWRGENVSTSEVENVISKACGYLSCVVYGVEIPNTEGRAGMAAIQINQKDIDMDDLYRNVSKSLAKYAVPLFVRICSDIEATGTYKLRKVTLQKEGYNPENITDLLFLVDHTRKTYVPFTQDMYCDILSGKMKL